MTDIHVVTENLNNIVVGDLVAKWNASGTRILRYYIDFRHVALNLHKELSAPELDILQNKVDVLMATWDKKQLIEEDRNSRSAGKELAAEMESEAGIKRDELRGILNATLSHDDTVDWDILKSNEPYRVPVFHLTTPRSPKDGTLPQPPVIGFFDRLFGGARKKQEEYERTCDAVKEANKSNQENYKRSMKKWAEERGQFVADQEKKKSEYDQRQAETNADVDRLHEAWLAGDPEAIVEHASLVLDASSYPDLIQKDYDLAYDPAQKTMIVEYLLPDPEQLPLTKTVRFVVSTGELKETLISQKDTKELFDDSCYQICLRTIHELFEADTPGYIQNIAFNGITNTTNKATGKNVEATIMSVLVSREEFLEINLDRIEPKACFKSLKGVAAASLAGLAAIPPVLRLDKDDRRIIDGKSVEIDQDGGTNLAAMDWEEFEHFVRELFEKEFASRGGEVKVTRSSSDGGVDAIAYDPDPITGGKIVIQAKRYTKTVGVSAVRDLYGTTLSEGASRGILVTTADFGPDAHKFCVDKPITLLNGANLLHLLAKHGIKANINLHEARVAMGLAGSSQRNR